MSRAKYYHFVLNNYDEDEYECLLTAIADPDIAYIAFAKEVGVQGTRHLQGHLELNRKLSMSQLGRKQGFDRIAWKVRRGTFDENEAYISKETVPERFGTRISVGRGARTDLASLHASLKEGSTLEQISNDHFASYVRYQRGINAWFATNEKPRDWPTEVIVYWGETGSGKTSKAFEEAPAAYMHPGGSWFDGYTSQSDVIFDDFGGSEFKLTYLLKLLDRYPMRVPIKGSFTQWKPKRIFITSNLNPRDWFPNAHPGHVAALFRRFSRIEEINIPKNPNGLLDAFIKK